MVRNLLTAFTALLARGCSQSRPNVILISLDTVSSDHVGAYGYRRDTTPNIDRRAGEGVVFENAFTPIPWTVGGHMSLLTSLYPTVALIWVLADHGEGFLEHGLMNHGNSVYEELIRVPLIARLPGGRFAGRRVKNPVSLIDVAPTVFDRLETAPLPRMQGRSLLPLIAGEPVDTGAVYVAGAYASCLRTDAWKFIENPDSRFETITRALKARHELYDLRQDPGEKTNLAPERGQAIERMTRALAGLESANRSVRKALLDGLELSDMDLSEKQRELLRGLGYIN